MTFNSLTFFVFLGIVYTAYRILPFRGQNTLLLVASYIFYGWWDTRFLFLIALSTTLDFWCSLLISQGQLTAKQRYVPGIWLILSAFAFLGIQGAGKVAIATVLVVAASLQCCYPQLLKLSPDRLKKLMLVTSLVANLSILGIFKYCNFFIDTAVNLVQSLGFTVEPWHLNILLPVGISFYTFQTLSYTVDVYRGDLKPTTNFWDYSLYLSFFPQLVAGPIERASNILPQLTKPRTLSTQQTLEGIYLILLGLLKKVAIADGIAGSVNSIYNNFSNPSWLDVVVATLLFTIQIYCDFSGYSHIARGIAKLLGIELMVNFNLPYFSKSPSEFWQRWHISLSSWLRDYLYIPLGGNRKGYLKTYRNLMITMLLGGLWHGAQWNFVLWGGYQGGLLCLYRWSDQLRPQVSSRSQNPAFQSRLQSFGAMGLFFGFTVYGWLLFRANSLGQVLNFSQILLTSWGNFTLHVPLPAPSALLGILFLVCYEALSYHTKHLDTQVLTRSPALIQGFLYATLTIVILKGMSNASSQFIYFQF